MLDRLAVELLHAQAKNPRAVPLLQDAAQTLLKCVGTWLTLTDADQLPFKPELLASDCEPGELAQTLRGLAEHLLGIAEIAEATRQEGELAATSFNPLSFADALDVLRTELADELSGPDAEEALALLRGELAFVAREARAWAGSLGASFDFPLPEDGCTAQECIAQLSQLSGALRVLAARATARASNDNEADERPRGK